MPYAITRPNDPEVYGTSAVALNRMMHLTAVKPGDALYTKLEDGGTLTREEVRRIAAVIPEDPRWIDGPIQKIFTEAALHGEELTIEFEFGIAGVKSSSTFISNSYR